LKQLRIHQIEENLKVDCLSSVKERVDRYLSVERLTLAPHTHFAPISGECLLLYRDGYFFACVSLCQSVAEALSKFLCQKAKIRSKGRHETRVLRLLKESVISTEIKKSFDKIQERRNDFHHLNPDVPSNRDSLRKYAYKALTELSEIEGSLFSFSINNGMVIPKNPEFWDC